MGKKREELEDRVAGLECDVIDILRVLLEFLMRDDERFRNKIELLKGMLEDNEAEQDKLWEAERDKRDG